jgi:hypothetical protein
VSCAWQLGSSPAVLLLLLWLNRWNSEVSCTLSGKTATAAYLL